MPEPEDKFVELLQRHRAGLRKEEIRRMAGVSSLTEIMDVLESLGKRGLVELLPGGKWRLVNPNVAPLASAAAPLSPPTRWRSFRDLCWYYAQCVRLEERPNLLADLEKEGADFLEIRRPIDWQWVAAGRTLRLPWDDETRGFVRHIKKGRRGDRLFLGAPVEVKSFTEKGTKKPRRIVSPVFVVQVEYRARRDELVLEPELMVDVNHGWLERSAARRHQELQQEFVESVGLREDDQGQTTGETNPMPRNPEVTNLSVLHRGLQATQRERWREWGTLDRPHHDPPLSEVIRDGFYNRVVLMAEPRMKYTRGLFAELKYLAKEASDEGIEASAIPLLFPPDAPRAVPVSTAQPDSSLAAVEGVSTAEYQILNDEQRRAVGQGLTAPLTIVTGPPGTGKSVVVGHVMANMALSARAVLFASRNHQALEAVEPGDRLILRVIRWHVEFDLTGPGPWLRSSRRGASTLCRIGHFGSRCARSGWLGHLAASSACLIA